MFCSTIFDKQIAILLKPDFNPKTPKPHGPVYVFDVNYELFKCIEGVLICVAANKKLFQKAYVSKIKYSLIRALKWLLTSNTLIFHWAITSILAIQHL